MALRARYTVPIQVVATPTMKARCLAVADREGVSLAEVYRRCIDKGLGDVELQSVRAFPPRDSSVA